jgi:hypothetical protein
MSSYDRARRQQVDPNKVLTGEELGDALDLIEFREEIGWPPDRGPAMTEPSPDELAEAERHLRVHLERAQGAEAFFLEPVRIVMAEYDRLKAVEQAATALVDHWDNARSVQPTGTDYTGRNFQLLNALAAAVRGETP